MSQTDIKTLHIAAGGGFDHVSIGTTAPVEPGPGEISVRLRASSLNFHDYLVVSGLSAPGERRIPMSDGAGEVIAVGVGVEEFAPGDHVVSTFFPTGWMASRRRRVLAGCRAMASTATHASR